MTLFLPLLRVTVKLFYPLTRCISERFRLFYLLIWEFWMKVIRRIQVLYENVTEIAITGSGVGVLRQSSTDMGANNILVNNDYEDVVKSRDATIRCIPAVKSLLFDPMLLKKP